VKRSRLLDAGQDTIYVYPEVKMRDSRNNLVKVPADTPIKIRATTSYDRSSIAELPGQIDVSVVKCVARDAPVGSWARVVYDNREWDLASPPRFSPGMSKTTRFVSFTLRSRPGTVATPSA
jgi:hypothetical protein